MRTADNVLEIDTGITCSMQSSILCNILEASHPLSDDNLSHKVMKFVGVDFEAFKASRQETFRPYPVFK